MIRATNGCLVLLNLVQLNGWLEHPKLILKTFWYNLHS